MGTQINQVQEISAADREELINKLIDFREGIDKIGLTEDDENIAKGEISVAVKEAKKDQPDISKIREKVKNSVDTIKEAGHVIEDVSELYEPAKKIAKIIGLAASVLI